MTIKTSLTHPIRIAELPALNGKIGITFCPGKKQAVAQSGPWDRNLDIDLADIRVWGATDLVTLIEPHEFIELQVQALPERAVAHGMRWHHLPIADQHAPGADFEQQWKIVLPRLLQSLHEGGNVLVHCKGGMGRAGTIAARLLLTVNPGLSADEAIALVRSVRRGAIETREQELYLHQHPY